MHKRFMAIKNIKRNFPASGALLFQRKLRNTILSAWNDLKKRNYFEEELKKVNIEFRRGNAGGGNQLRQPYIKDIVKNINLKNFKNVAHVHFFGYYIGNYPSLKSEKIIKITNFLNSLDL